MKVKQLKEWMKLVDFENLPDEAEISIKETPHFEFTISGKF